MAPSKRVALVLAATVVVAASFAFLVLAATGAADAVAGAPFVLAAVVGVLALAAAAAVANALAGPGGPQGPDGPTPADRRREANEWNDPPGVDVDDEETDE